MRHSSDLWQILEIKKLKAIRQKLKWTYASIARKMKIHWRTVYNWEKGITIPSEEKIWQLAGILGIPVDNISDIKTTSSSQIDFNVVTKSWMSLFEEREESKKEINYISNILGKLHSKLNNASLVIMGILNSLDFPIYVKNINQRYIVINNAFKKNISTSGQDGTLLHNMGTDYDYFNKKEAEKNFYEDQSVINGNKPVIIKEDYIPGSNKKRWALIHKIPIYDDFSQLAGLIGAFIDITERKKSEYMTNVLKESLKVIDGTIWIAKKAREAEDGGVVFENILYSTESKLEKDLLKMYGLKTLAELRNVLCPNRIRCNLKEILEKGRATYSADIPSKIENKVLHFEYTVYYNRDMDLFIGICQLNK